MAATNLQIGLSKFECIVMGVSTGGMKALPAVLASLPMDFPIPVVVVLHMYPDNDGCFLVEYFDERLLLKVTQALEKETVTAGSVYIAPPNYHLLIERDKTFSLSVDERLNYSRPAINVLFESAAEAYGSSLVGVILTGASADGADGLRAVKDNGGIAVAQDPNTAEAGIMPLAAIATGQVDYVLTLAEIADLLQALPAGYQSKMKTDATGALRP